VVTEGTGQSATFEAGDLNGDGHLDLLVLGTDGPFNGSTMPPVAVRPGRVFLGDGRGGFDLAPASLFPVDELLTVAPRKVLWADFNGDGRLDVFVADHGWDGPPFPGQQNLLYLSTPEGGWRSATATLPQGSDFSHTAAAADIDRDGDIDIFVGNGYNNSGAPATAPYLLINDGQGNFTRNDADVPVAPGQALYMFPAGGGAVHFAGTAFSDLDRDGWPDLVVTAEVAGSFDKFGQTTIFWNQDGRFDTTNVTRLAEPAGLPLHTDLDADFADFDGDGLMDIVLIGTNQNPYYDGGYVQVFRGLGQQQFLDVSAQVLSPEGRGSAVDGVRTGNPWPMWVRVGDFNGDLAPDFRVEYTGGTLRQDTPIVWINDGKGGFSVIKVAFFVETGQEWQFGSGLLVESSTGFQNYSVQSYPGSGGLLLTGRATSTPYFGRPDDAGAEVLVGTAATNWFVGGRGNDVIDGGAGLDWATYEGSRSRYEVSSLGSGDYRVAVLDGSSEGTDTLESVERLKFADTNVALDLFGHAGTVAKILGAVFGKQYVANKDVVGIGLSLLDGGMSYADLVALAVSTDVFAELAGSRSNVDFVNFVYENIVGSQPGQADLSHYVDLLNTGVHTQASLAYLACETDLNKLNIDLVGLAGTGIEYTPLIGG
jgi:hypothetical protein